MARGLPVIYLLDVNVLLALGYANHVHHRRAMDWIAQQRDVHAPSGVKFLTCAITELGFVRIASGPACLAVSVREARIDLQRLKLRERMHFISDRIPAAALTQWVAKSAQTTDGHLLVLAKLSGARLATLDQFIPDAAFVPSAIPDVPYAPLKPAQQCRCGA